MRGVKFYLILPLIVGVLSGSIVSLFELLIDLVRDAISGIPTLYFPFTLTLIVLLSEIFIHLLDKGAHAYGTDSVIEAYHTSGRVNLKTGVIKALASAMVIGAGAPAGKLAPSAVAGSAIASKLSDLFKLSESQRRAFLAVGFGSGLSAILKAPLAGAVMSAEIFFKRDFDSYALIPGFVASSSAYIVFGLIHGFEPLFNIKIEAEHNIDALFLFIGLSLFLVPFVKVYVYTYRKLRELFSLITNSFVRTSVGAFTGGLICLLIPSAFYGGVEWIPFLIEGTHTDIEFLLLSILGITVGTSLVIGSGISGGLFGPTLATGAFLGHLYAQIVEKFFNTEVNPAEFTVVAMASFLAGSVNAPLSNIILVAEITGGYSLLIYSMLSVFITYVLTSKDTLFASQVDTRYESPAFQSELDLFILNKLRVKEHMTKDLITVSPDVDVEKIRKLLKEKLIGGLPVVEEGKLVGIVTKEDIAYKEGSKAKDVMTRKIITIEEGRSLSEAIKLMVNEGIGRLPVLNSKGELVGIITRADIGRALRKVKLQSSNILSKKES